MSCVRVCMENVCHVFGWTQRMYVMCLGVPGECMSCVWVYMENICHVFGCAWGMYVMCLGGHGEWISCVWVCMETVCFCICSRLHRLLNPWWFVWLFCSLSLASCWRAPLAAHTPSSSCPHPPLPPPSSPSTRAPKGRATKMVSVNALPLAVRFLSAVFNFRIVE